MNQVSGVASLLAPLFLKVCIYYYNVRLHLGDTSLQHLKEYFHPLYLVKTDK